MKVNYNESTETLQNPEMGYPCFARWQDMKADGIILGNGAQGTVPALRGYTNQLYTLTAFTKNGGGKDMPITDKALAALADQLDELAAAGGATLLRFAYDSRGERDREPEQLETIIAHIGQIGDVLHEHSAAIAGMEAGIIGLFGEMHTSKYCGEEYSRPIIQALLDACPDKKPVLLRSPVYLKAYTQMEYKDIAEWTPEPDSDAARLGFYNDGYMGSDSDLGTWMEDHITRKEGIDYLNRTGHRSFYGGEYSGAWWWTTRFSAWLPENAIPEMYRSHVDYIRGNIFHDEHVSYEPFIYGEDYEYSWFPDNSAYYGINCHKFIRDHLGYRLVVRESNVSARGGSVSLTGKIENTGFSSVINKKHAQVILRDQAGHTFTVPVDFDVRDLRSVQTTPYAITAALPAGIPAGKYAAYLRVCMHNATEELCVKSAIRFANIDIFDEELGANFLGEFEVTPHIHG